MGIGVEPVLLFLIIFFWTPPHFWALSLVRADDYARARVPMLPVVAGPDETRRQILIYSLVLVPLGVAPWLLGYADAVYGVIAPSAASRWWRWRWRVRGEREGEAGRARRQAAVRLLDPLSVPAVCRAPGRGGLSGFFGRVAV